MQKQVMEDWFHLFRDTFSNSECVHFLKLKDKFAASYLLYKLNLEKISPFNSRRYTISQSFWHTKENRRKAPI